MYNYMGGAKNLSKMKTWMLHRKRKAQMLLVILEDYPSSSRLEKEEYA